MKQMVNFTMFCDAFNDERRETFSYEGKRALFDYIEQYDEETGEDSELDIVSLCCEYTEYKSMDDFWEDYSKEEYPDIESIEDATSVIKIDGESFIIQQF